MTFSENLIRLRKSRGLSQEELAARISVSRQAVSKWENGDAMPDLNNLLLLAQALEVTLDELCKGEAPAEQVPAPAKKPVGLIILCIVLSLMLLTSLALLFSLPSQTEQRESSHVQILTEQLTVTGVTFSGKSSKEVQYQFVPSLGGEKFLYRISFTDSDGSTSTFPVKCEGGVCSGTVELYGLAGYTVSVSVDYGDYSTNLAVAQGLTFSEGHASWTPLN